MNVFFIKQVVEHSATNGLRLYWAVFTKSETTGKLKFQPFIRYRQAREFVHNIRRYLAPMTFREEWWSDWAHWSSVTKQRGGAYYTYASNVDDQ